MSEIMIGSEWMTRDGRKAVVEKRTLDPRFPWRGHVGGVPVSWSESGRFYANERKLNGLDLVAPWIDSGPLLCLDAPFAWGLAPSAPQPAADDIAPALEATSVPAAPAADALEGVTKRSLLEEAIAVTAGRGKSYGRPEDNFERIARLWNAHLVNRHADGEGGDTSVALPRLDAVDVAIMMGLMKVARLANDPAHHDSWVDLAGYAACGGEIAGGAR